MKKRMLTAICALALLSFGCATAKTEPNAPEMVSFTAETETAALNTATKFGNGFYAALQSGNFASWQQVMPSGFARPVTAEKFNAMRRDLMRIYGVPAQFTYLNVIRNGKVRDYLWRISFTAPNRDVCDVVWGVRVYCEKGKEPQIGGFRFYPFGMPDKK